MVTKREPVRVNPVLIHLEECRVSLDGQWCFRLDPENNGKSKCWYSKPNIFQEKINVPGCWQEQGFGNKESKDEIWDFQIQANVFQSTYHGTGWYKKYFQVPKEWKSKRIWLNFGGVHPSAEIWLNGKFLGIHSGPFVPFGFDVTDIVSFNNDNFLVVCIYEENRWLGFAYNWKGYWSGLYRSVELTATGDYWLDQFFVCPDVDNKKIKFNVELKGNLENNLESFKFVVTVSTSDGIPVADITKKINKKLNFDLPIQSPKLWSPDEPNLYHIDALLYHGEDILDAITERIGFVKLSTIGKHFLINNEPYYIRGTGDFANNPETGSPDTNRDRWRKKLATLRKYGYNYVRCQSYVPTPEYYDVADEVGLLIQGEMGMLGAWAGSSIWHIYAWPQPLPEYRELIRWQWNNTVIRDVNHPSANIYCMSNELRKETLFPETAWQCYYETKKIKPGSFVIWTDGGYNKKLPADFINVDVVDTDGKKTNESDIYEGSSLPVIQHEFRWWSSYPDVRIKDKYRGGIRPYVIEIVEEAANRSNNMTKLLPIIAKNSQRLQYIEAKTKLENCRRDNPKLAGISHFTAMDIGFSSQGILDEFYETKYIDADTWKQTIGDTVILVDKNFDDRILIAGGIFECRLFISDFSHPSLKDSGLQWELTDGKKCFGSGKFTFKHKPFRTFPIGKIKLTLPYVSKPIAMKLYVVVYEKKRKFSNQWNFWIFPREVKFTGSIGIYGKPKNTWLKKFNGFPYINSNKLLSKNIPRVIITEVLDKSLIKYTSNGGKIFLVASEGLVRPFYPKLGLIHGRYFFTPPANYPPYEDGYSGTIVRNHKMLGDFPNEGFCDLQFYRMVAESPAISLQPFSLLKQKPVIQVFSTYYVCHPLAHLIEFGVGKGGIIISSLNFNPDLPEAKYLLSNILKYTINNKFKPKNHLKRICAPDTPVPFAPVMENFYVPDKEKIKSAIRSTL